MTNLLTYLKYEKQLLKEMVILAQKQQGALIKFNTNELDRITSYQFEVSKSLKQAEEKRIKMLMSMFGISRSEASNLKLSTIIEKMNKDDVLELESMKGELNSLISSLQQFNTLNRVLANRARNSVREILSILTNGTNNVCNVTV
ncbi:MAG: flagellar export chaperone FlgN [Ignavibacteriae bacterium]|nr:flagellar export chaperone FlgN [Ignavibacteriota bacterium]